MLLRKAVDRYRTGGAPALIRGAMRIAAPARYRELFADPSPLEPALAQLTQQAEFSIIQVGAYVGDTYSDPIAAFLKRTLSTSKHDATVVLIEPLQPFFDQLKANYGMLRGVHFENVAIADFSGERDFYYLDCDPVAHGHPEWLRQLSSLRPDRMTTAWNAYEKDGALQEFYLAHRAKTSVRCVTLRDIMGKYSIATLDLLQIDAEGYDFEILKTIDFRNAPRFINFESSLLSPTERSECDSMLRKAGYDLLEWGSDTFCTLGDRSRVVR